jgi:aerobic-type carbon monoxide dehydrogenase small subunit (CoxS/CutS family)
MSTHTIRLTVNGTEHEAEVPARLTLADFLRERLDLTATHLGCEHGVCGACTILLDGETALVHHARRPGRRVGHRHPGGRRRRPTRTCTRSSRPSGTAGMQCGFCTPGIILSTIELLGEHPQPTREQIDDALGGHLCRCTGVREDRRGGAAGRPRDERGPPVTTTDSRAFGARLKRKEDPRLLRGRGKYVSDIKLHGMLHAAVVRSHTRTRSSAASTPRRAWPIRAAWPC